MTPITKEVVEEIMGMTFDFKRWDHDDCGYEAFDEDSNYWYIGTMYNNTPVSVPSLNCDLLDVTINSIEELKERGFISKGFRKTSEEVSTDHFLVEDGDIFDGTREMFMDCFFSNASNGQIIEWCFQNEFTLEINSKKIISKKH